jgi:Flp pilus assembly protein TadG
MLTCTTRRTPLSRVGRRLGQERGQTLVEFAVVLPVLILIILGILYFGRYEDYANQETQLAEEGVRWAAVNYSPSSGTLQSYIQSQAQPELQSGSSDVSAAKVWIYQPSGATYATGQAVRVCVVTTVSFPTPIGAPSTTIAEAATMRLEQISSTASSLPYTSGNPSGNMPSQCPSS